MSTPEPVIYQRHRLTVADYHRIGTAGIVSEADRVELIEGEIIDMAPIGSEHAAVVRRLVRLFDRVIGEQAIVSAQDPVWLSSFSEPEPDIALLRYRDDFFRHAHPRPGDVLLIVEVADTSLRYDREVKLPLYARHAILEVWIVDLENRCLQVFREPAEGGYKQVQTVDRPGVMAPLQLPDCRIDLSSLF
ncbi:MAG: Uma2 family endonuclease [Gammaproteobacteria bacterium]